LTIIVRPNQLAELCAQIDATGRFAMDMEFIPERTYDPQLCLVQIATDHDAFIIDPQALDDLDSLWQRVSNPNILVVLHAAEQDLDLVYGFSGLVPQNIMDTQIAAGFAGFGYPIGYGKLLSHLLGIHLSKTESFTDWTHRPLTPAQIDYALDDVRHLLPLHDRLMDMLVEAGRFPWVQEECRRYTTNEQYATDRSRDYLRVKGASSLPRRGLAVLQSLCNWRHEEAYRQNRPPRSILQDNILLELSRRPPRETNEISRIRGARADQIRVYGSSIMEAIKRGQSVPEEQCPVWPASKSPPRRDVLVVDILFAALKVVCYDLDLAPELVATRADLEFLVRSYREGKLESRDIPVLQGWRYEIAGKMLMDLLKGATLEVKVVQSDPPVRLRIDDSTKRG
jgi:ribonuclease D